MPINDIGRKKTSSEIFRTPRWLRGPPRSLQSIINPEEVLIYRRMRKAIIQELRPKTPLEWIWVNEVVNAQFSAMRYGAWQADAREESALLARSGSDRVGACAATPLRREVSTMTNRFLRENAWGRAQPACSTAGQFQTRLREAGRAQARHVKLLSRLQEGDARASAHMRGVFCCAERGSKSSWGSNRGS